MGENHYFLLFSCFDYLFSLFSLQFEKGIILYRQYDSYVMTV